jgi:hypothetical protein
MDDAMLAPDVIGVPSWEARRAWPLVESMLAPAIALTGGAYEPNDVLADIEKQNAQLWVVLIGESVVGAVVSTIIVYPRLTSLACPFVGGADNRLADWWRPTFEMLEAFARAKGCKRIEGGVRKGWARLLPGMESVGVMLRKDL